MTQGRQIDVSLEEKHRALRSALQAHGGLAVAFSGGVDSALLLAVAHEALGDRVLAVTTRSASIPTRETEEARAFCRERGIRHVVVETHEFEIEGFDRNPPYRCYVCKREILSCIFAAAAREGFATVAEGSNLDDADDYRPGARAVREAGAISPLRDAGFTKADVRALARRLGLSQWDKPAFACLNSRFAYGEPVTPERLAMVDAAEQALRAMGFPQVRVRVHGDVVRVEVPAADVERLASASVRTFAVEKLRALGFTYVALDLQGYRTGSMNESIRA